MKVSDSYKPVGIPTRETAAFVTEHLRPGTKVLEIGCGEGYVAFELQDRGFEVTGLDADPDSVLRAAEIGVNAICGDWPEVVVPEFDAVAFTRSLHHIEDLSGAIEKTADVLPDGGVLLLEDFAFNATDRKTMDWFLKLIHSKPISFLISPNPDEFVTRMLAAENPLKEWEHDKHHDLHSAESMRKAISKLFDIELEQHGPYFYRYLVPVFPETIEAAALVEQVLTEEKTLGSIGEILLIGRRIVAVKR